MLDLAGATPTMLKLQSAFGGGSEPLELPFSKPVSCWQASWSLTAKSRDGDIHQTERERERERGRERESVSHRLPVLSPVNSQTEASERHFLTIRSWSRWMRWLWAQSPSDMNPELGLHTVLRCLSFFFSIFEWAPDAQSVWSVETLSEQLSESSSCACWPSNVSSS